MRKLTQILIALALTFSMGVAFAQQLTFTGNGVQVSSDGEMVQARNGQDVAEGQTLQVPAGATATITYPNGTVLTFNPGTYTIPSMATASSIAGTTLTTGSYAGGVFAAAIVAGVVVITALTIDNVILDEDDDEAPPLSL